MFGKQIPSRMMFIALISTLLLTTTLLAGRTLAERAEVQGSVAVNQRIGEKVNEWGSVRERDKSAIRNPKPETTITYTYDDAGRLVGVDYSEDQDITYTYDAAGNLLQREVTVIMKVYLPMLFKGR